MSAVLLLPRQFQVAVVENVNENHLRKAMWLFPLYLIIINLFVLPVAFGGMLKLGARGLDADTFVLALPLAAGQSWLAMLTYMGGLSAASSMIIVETIALSVMMSNHLLMPLLVRVPAAQPDAPNPLVCLPGPGGAAKPAPGRGAVLLLAYAYYVGVGKELPLVNTGLVSFAAVAQFVPAVLGGLYWKGGTRRGATVGLLGGFSVWFFTLVLPTMVGPGQLPVVCLPMAYSGKAGCGRLRCLGSNELDYLSHGLFWSWFFNIGLYVGVSLAVAAHGAGTAAGRRVRGRISAPQPGRRRAGWQGQHSVSRRAGAARGLSGKEAQQPGAARLCRALPRYLTLVTSMPRAYNCTPRPTRAC